MRNGVKEERFFGCTFFRYACPDAVICLFRRESIFLCAGVLLSRAGARRSHPMGRTFLPSLFRRPESLRHVRFIYKIHFLTLFPIRAIRVISDPKLFRLCLEKMRSAQKKNEARKGAPRWPTVDYSLSPWQQVGAKRTRFWNPPFFKGMQAPIRVISSLLVIIG